MIGLLIDHNIEGQAALLWTTITTEGWLDLIPMRLMRFSDIELAHDSNDRIVWRIAQKHQLLLLTANRNMDDQDSLEQTLREENTLSALPVITISSIDRMLEMPYRIRCATRIAEIAIYVSNYLGTGRIFIP